MPIFVSVDGELCAVAPSFSGPRAAGFPNFLGAYTSSLEAPVALPSEPDGPGKREMKLTLTGQGTGLALSGAPGLGPRTEGSATLSKWSVDDVSRNITNCERRRGYGWSEGEDGRGGGGAKVALGDNGRLGAAIEWVEGGKRGSFGSILDLLYVGLDAF
ncbi:hypothetical protein M427DRAFT_33710 [Gonapodya prolifera JEL478]|uniref:Uncharacterized protein n=1 Tax=Gonapodya prolifera (strain JEL478) TaxID=1344416 RepID=A0A139AAA7_GONPJ|nr:hypothetical protein M427DRAFT_33710 [Gonapodya prolifera JEL478]|eukprot:KXS13741.1 hypothetical protein M427DRAFT_33710 [Gonapodya prolifera JEL478]